MTDNTTRTKIFIHANITLSTGVRFFQSMLPTNKPRVFHVETAWKRSFPRRFNVEYTWYVCRAKGFLITISVIFTSIQSYILNVPVPSSSYLFFLLCTWVY